MNILNSFTAFLTIVGCVAFICSPVRAETDYRCLNLCVNAGKPTASCMSQCSPTDLSQATKKTVSPNDLESSMITHRVLGDQQTVESGKIFINSAETSPYRVTKDYKCITACLKTKMLYQTCDESCTTISDKNGQVLKPASNVVATTSIVPSSNAKHQ